MPFDSHKLCRLVENYPCLYNPNLADYSKKDVIERAWNEISFTMKESASECRTRWYNIRGNFSKTLKNGMFLNPNERKKYYLDEELNFLRPYMKSVNKLRILQEKPYEVDLNEDTPLQEEQIFVNGEYSQDAYEPPTPPKRKKPNNDNVQADPLADAVMSLLNHTKEGSDEDSPDLYFLKSLLPDLNRMSDVQKYRFKRKVLEIIGEILYEDDENGEKDSQKDNSGVRKNNFNKEKDHFSRETIDDSPDRHEAEWAKLEEESQEF